MKQFYILQYIYICRSLGDTTLQIFVTFIIHYPCPNNKGLIMSMQKVSVYCTEQGKDECWRCHALEPQSGCGWCLWSKVCTAEFQCKVIAHVRAECMQNLAHCFSEMMKISIYNYFRIKML